MKLTIKQHTENLRNAKSTLTREQLRLVQLSRNAEELRQRVEFADLQLQTAIRGGRTDYDPDRYLRNRR